MPARYDTFAARCKVVMLEGTKSVADTLVETVRQSRQYNTLEAAKIGLFYSQDGLASEQLRANAKSAALKREWTFADFRSALLSASSFNKPIENLAQAIDLKPLQQSIVRLHELSRTDGFERARCIHSQLGSAKIILGDTSVSGPYGGVSLNYTPLTSSVPPSQIIVTGLMHTHPPPPQELRGQRSDHASIADIMNLLAGRFLQASIIIADEAILLLLKNRDTVQDTDWKNLEWRLMGLQENCSREGSKYGHEYKFTEEACSLLKIGLYRIEWSDLQFVAKRQPS